MAYSMDEVLDAASVIPVLTVERIADAAPIAQALHAGGVKVVEMTLRTPDALDIMQAIKAAEPDLIVGMGTLRAPDQVAACLDAKADFLVSPGLTGSLARAMLESGVPALPGVATASEAMTAAEAGFEALKFFPAEQAGGAPYLKSLYGPLPDIRFCPTGSISQARAPSYLALPNVACVGGSWIAPGDVIKRQEWGVIEVNAAAAAALKH